MVTQVPPIDVGNGNEAAPAGWAAAKLVPKILMIDPGATLPCGRKLAPFTMPFEVNVGVAPLPTDSGMIDIPEVVKTYAFPVGVSNAMVRGSSVFCPVNGVPIADSTIADDRFTV